VTKYGFQLEYYVRKWRRVEIFVGVGEGVIVQVVSLPVGNLMSLGTEICIVYSLTWYHARRSCNFYSKFFTLVEAFYSHVILSDNTWYWWASISILRMFLRLSLVLWISFANLELSVLKPLHYNSLTKSNLISNSEGILEWWVGIFQRNHFFTVLSLGHKVF